MRSFFLEDVQKKRLERKRMESTRLLFCYIVRKSMIKLSGTIMIMNINRKIIPLDAVFYPSPRISLSCCTVLKGDVREVHLHEAYHMFAGRWGKVHT